MKEFLRCKACGFIMNKENAPGICPACGVPDRVFEEFSFKLSPRRKFIMDLDLHPIILHLPQAISGMIPFFGILSMLTDASIGVKFLYSVEVITYLLPLSVLVTIATGMLDGHNRFRKLSTPAIRKKILLASILFLLTSAMAFIAYNGDIRETLFPLMGLSIVTLFVEAVLSKIGIRLISAYLPG